MTPYFDECFISVDVEASGPVPGIYSLLSIGACLAEDKTVTFECLLKPISRKADAKALEISGFTLEQLDSEGQEPEEAMKKFDAWVKRVAGSRTPIFVGLNAGFDWSFINYYFHLFQNANPFGFAPLDIKALYMGVTGSAWKDSKTSHMEKVLNPKLSGNHNALTDAQAQAELFCLTLEYGQKNRGVD